MATGRLLRYSLCESEKISNLSDFEYRVWTVLILLADDAGRGDARPAIIKGKGFPLRERVTTKDIDAAVHGLAGKGMIKLYEKDGIPLLQITSWETMYPELGRKSRKYKEWRKSVFERDNYTCQICGKRGGNLNAHHIKRYRNNIEDRTNTDNGITLCEKCHRELHKREGK